jgi:hypothetical protein
MGIQVTSKDALLNEIENVETARRSFIRLGGIVQGRYASGTG